MKNIKNGISLIVLVITIIIMIILAATIIISLNNTGIIGAAENAVCMTNIKQTQNLAVLTWSNIYTNPDKYNMDNIDQKLKEEFEKNGLKYEDYNIEITKNGIDISSKAGCIDSSGVEGGSSNNTPATDWVYAYTYNRAEETWTAVTTNDEPELTGDIVVKMYKNGTMEGTSFDLYDMVVSGTGEFDTFGNISLEDRIKINIENAGSFPVEFFTQSLKIEEGITTIRNFKIKDMETSFPMIKNIKLPNSLTIIGEYAFCHACNLEILEMGTGLINIEHGAFKYTNLESINLPNGLKTIGAYAFDGCIIKSVVIPDTVTEIGEWAFQGSELETIVVPKSIVSVGSKWLYMCESLQTIYFKGKEAEWNAISGISGSGIRDTVQIVYNYTGD